MTDEKESAERLMDGTSWNQFLDQLRAAGEVVLREGSPSDGLSRAEAFRYLARVTRAALETFIENSDPTAPTLGRVVHETAKMGADNPDNQYFNAAIDGAGRYVIRGRRGTVSYLAFATQIGHYGQGAGMPTSGFLEAQDIRVNDDGTFEIDVCADDPGPGRNWLPTTPETGTLIVRQTFFDRERETPATLTIERVDRPNVPRPLEPARMDDALTQSGNLVFAVASLFSSWAEGFQKHVNELPVFDPDLARAFGGDPNIVYYHSYWRLAADEALVIDATPPECPYWNFQLNNHWMESLDYRYFRVHVNKASATYRDDGSVRVVVAHRDPGDATVNWIDTAGHAFGTMCWRWVRAKEHPQPRTRVVPVSDVPSLE